MYIIYITFFNIKITEIGQLYNIKIKFIGIIIQLKLF